MAKPLKRFYEFGAFRVDVSNRLLLRGSEPVPLTLKAFDTLLVLVERGGEVVEKDELMRLVWPDVEVEENNLTQQISLLRKSLGDSRDAPRFIETMSRRGYRFIARVRETFDAEPSGAEVAAAETAAASHASKQTPPRPTPLWASEGLALAQRASTHEPRPVHVHSHPSTVRTPHAPSAQPSNAKTHAPRRPWRRAMPALILILVAVALALAVFYARGPRTAEPPSVKSIAVLPFRPLVPEAGDVYLELGMADALITRLSNIRSITVRPTSAVLNYAGADRDPATVGRALDVDAVLDGRVQRIGGRVRVTVQLVGARDGAALWADTFDEEFTEIFRVQDSISERMADALTLKLTGEERRLLVKRQTTDTEAYELYLRGHYYWFKWTEEGWLKSLEYFRRAVEKDPNFALAYVGLADAYGTLGFVRPPREVFPKSKEFAQKALELDETLPDVHLPLGAIKMFYEWDRAGARREFERALQLNPNSALAHDLSAIHFGTDGQAERAIAEARRAQELDPLSPYMNTDLGMAFYYARRYDEALPPIRKALDVDPRYQDGLGYLAAVYEQKGMYAEAVVEWQKILKAQGDERAAEALGAAYASGGYRGAVLKWLDILTERSRAAYVTPLSFAELHARLGDKEQTLAWLERAYEDRSPGLIWLKVDPRWDSLRAEPRFQDLLKRLNLTP